VIKNAVHNLDLVVAIFSTFSQNTKISNVVCDSINEQIISLKNFLCILFRLC